MMNPQREQNDIISIQIIASFLTVVSAFISIALLYNQQLIIQNKEPFFDKDTALQISYANRIFIIVIILLFLSSNLWDLDFDKRMQKSTELDHYEILGSILTLGAGLAALYVAKKSLEEDSLTLADVDNAIL